MPPTPKSRNPQALENNLRTAALRQGKTIVRLPTPDPTAVPRVNRFIVIDRPTGQVLSPTLDLLGLEQWVRHPETRPQMLAPVLVGAQ